MAALAAGLTGCAGGQRTPAATLAKLADSLAAFDRAAVLACLDGTDAEMEAAGALLDLAIASDRFRRAMIHAYGQRAWGDFQESSGARITPIITCDRQAMAGVRIVESGDAAEAALPGKARSVRLVRKDGRWRVRAADVLTVGGSPHEAARRWWALAEFVRLKARRIGRPGVRCEDLDREIAAGLDVMLPRP